MLLQALADASYRFIAFEVSAHGKKFFGEIFHKSSLYGQQRQFQYP
jgi:hypothetical protein